MASDTVQQIKDRLNIVDVVSQYVKLDRAGTTLKARCPFHAEKSPSFVVSPERGTYHCFGCGVGGDIFSFIEAIEGLDFKGALRVLADKAGVEIVYSHAERQDTDERDRLFSLMETAALFFVSRLDDAARKYLADRGMHENTIKSFRVGWAGNGWSDCSDYLKSKKFAEKEIIDAGLGKKNERGGLLDKFRNRIMFPIADSAGRVIAFSGRSFGEHASPEAPKYLNSPETALFHKSRILYGFDKAKVDMRKLGCAVLVEGQMDLLSSHQAGWGNTVAVSGTAFTQEHAALIKRMTENLVIALDGDAAGIKAAGRAARIALASGLNVKVAQLPDGLDPADLVQKDGPGAWSAAIKSSKDIITFLLDVLEAHAKNDDAFRRSVELVVLPFLSDVQSPIAREQHEQEIARRLHVSPEAIASALSKQRAAEPVFHEERSAPTVTAPAMPDRARQAYSILLWQRTVPTPAIELESFEEHLKDALGADIYAALGQMGGDEEEHLRFSAERLYAGADDLERSSASLLSAILRDRLARELEDTRAALELAERRDDEPAIEQLVAQSRVLTTRIAQLHSIV